MGLRAGNCVALDDRTPVANSTRVLARSDSFRLILYWKRVLLAPSRFFGDT